MAIAPETIEEVLRTANVYDVISEYITLEKAGSNYRALCPFHTEKTPSFMVSPSKNIFKCFGCGKSGNAVKFVMEYEGLSFSEAIVKIAQKYNIPVKYTKPQEDTSHLTGLYEVIKKISSFYKEELKKSAKAKKYLSERGILFSTADFFNIGYSPEDPDKLLDFCKKENISIDQLKDIGLVTVGEKGVYDRFKGRIVFPIKDHRGRIVAFGGRSIDGKNPKYLNSPETKIYLKSKVLYGFFEARDTLREKKEVIIVEGYFDLLSLYQVGIKNVVATLGTALTGYHGKLLKKFVNKAVLMFDSDKAGKQAAVRGAKILLSQGIDVYYVPLKEKDPDLLAKSGRKTVEETLDKAQDFLKFLLSRIKEEKELKKQKNLIDLYLDVVSYIPDKHVQGLYLKELSKEIGIPLNLLEVKDRNFDETEEEEQKNIQKYLFYSEKIILKTLVLHKEEILRSFNNFDKIEGSDYFLYLLELVLNNKLSEEELEEIKNFPVPENLDTALEALNQLHQKWIKKQLEISALFNKVDEKVLSLFLENIKRRK
jgi:DNA primase